MIYGRSTMMVSQQMAEVTMFNPSIEYLIGLSKISGLPEEKRPPLFVRDDDGSLISAKQVIQEHFGPKRIGFIHNQ
jgi:hypothetical protein